jgi:hypothetical protein
MEKRSSVCGHSTNLRQKFKRPDPAETYLLGFVNDTHFQDVRWYLAHPLPGNISIAISPHNSACRTTVRHSTASPPNPGTQVFDPAKWAAANPGRDVNSAIAEARAQGYKIAQPLGTMQKRCVRPDLIHRIRHKFQMTFSSPTPGLRHDSQKL